MSRIKQILRQITPERKKKEIKTIRKIKLSSELQKWIKEYEKVGERDGFIWKWLYVVNKVFVCPSVSRKYHKSLVETKFLFNMFIVLIDDVSEKKDSKFFLGELLKVPFRREEIKFVKLNKKEIVYLKFTRKLWRQIERNVKKYPRYNKSKEVFNYDIVQLLNAVEFGRLVCKHYHLINEEEYWAYFPWSMQIVLDYDMDLMCVSRLTDNELRIYRNISLYAQKMGRIGNWISTWEREFRDNDFTSCVFPYALQNNILTLKDIKNNNSEHIIKKIKKFKAEKYLLKKWEGYYQEIDKFSLYSTNINIKKILETLEYLIFMHLISRGYK